MGNVRSPRPGISLDSHLITSQEGRHKLEQLMFDRSPSNVQRGRKLRTTIEHVHLDISLPYESQLGGMLALKVEVLAEYTDDLPFKKWTLPRLEAHMATTMAEPLDRHVAENGQKGQKDVREILVLLKLEGVDPAVAAVVLYRSSTVNIRDLPTMIGEAFDLIGTIIPVWKPAQKLMASTRKSWRNELELRASRPQEL